MKLLRKLPLYRAFGGVVGILLLTTSFQNCGKAGFDSELPSKSDSSVNIDLSNRYGASLGKKIEGIPFAFDVSFDTISLNSCAASHLASRSVDGGYYTIKAGAYTSKAGVKVTDEFYNYLVSEFVKNGANNEVTREAIKSYIADSPMNRGTQPVASIRQVNNLLAGIDKIKSTNYSQGPALGMLTELGTAEVLESLISEKQYNSYLSRSTGDGSFEPYFPFIQTGLKNFEMDVIANDTPNLTARYMTELSSAQRLILGFSVPNTEANNLLNPLTGQEIKTLSKAYGRGYKLNFGRYAGLNVHQSNPDTVISSVVEYDLMNSSKTLGNWTCDSKKRLMVVRNADLQKTPGLCPPMSIATIENNRALISVIRRHLPAHLWDINVDPDPTSTTDIPCAVPKSGVSCYNENSITQISKTVPNLIAVDYTLKNECYNELDGASYSGATPNSLCAKFISFCEKQ